MRTNNYDRKIDILIINTLQEIARDYEISDTVKIRIDQRIKENKNQLRTDVEDC